jgi:hypothetical protein
MHLDIQSMFLCTVAYAFMNFFWFIANLPVIKKSTNMHSGYAHQHVRLCASEKKHKVTCRKIEPQFFTKLKNFAHYITSYLYKNKTTSTQTTNHPNPTK